MVGENFAFVISVKNYRRFIGVFVLGAALSGGCVAGEGASGQFLSDQEFPELRVTINAFEKEIENAPVDRLKLNQISNFVFGQLAPQSELLAAEAADRFADALAAKKDVAGQQDSYQDMAVFMHKVSARFQLVGNPLPLTGVTTGGAQFDLKSLKGKVVIVDIFATWCPPCVSTMHRELDAVYRQHNANGLEIVALSVDEDRGALDKFMAEKQDPWTILHDQAKPGKHQIVDDYQFSTLPTVIIIGRDGNVVTTLGKDGLTGKINDLMAVETAEPTGK